MGTTRDDHLEIAVGDASIAGTLVTPGALIPGVLFVHGWGGNEENETAYIRLLIRWLGELIKTARSDPKTAPLVAQAVEAVV